MLRAARKQYRIAARIAELAVAQAKRQPTATRVAAVVGMYQLASATATLEATPDLLAEQGIDAPAVARVIPASLVTGPRVAQMVEQTEADYEFDRLVASLIQDANRAAAQVDATTRPTLTSYIRSLSPPSCARCAVLAGRVYRYSDGFLRHPGCDCLMTPTTEAAGKGLVTDPVQAFEDGQVSGLSKADAQALRDGADMGQVVNVRRRAAGLTRGGSVLNRGRRLTPAGIYGLTADRDRQIGLLREHGYIT